LAKCRWIMLAKKGMLSVNPSQKHMSISHMGDICDTLVSSLHLPYCFLLPMTSTGELSELLAISNTPSRSSRGRRRPLSRQTARSQDSGGEDTGIPTESEVRP
jgi:hypothetical protein